MTYRGRKILVTGADGFIGSHLAESLVEHGAEVTALCLYNSFDAHGWLDDLPRARRAALSCVRGDVRDAAFMRHLVSGKEVVFHLAALIAIPHSYVAAQSYVETNILGTLNVLEAARQAGIERVVHTSTSEVYGSALVLPVDENHPLQGQSPYAASKIGADMMAEAYARSFGLRVAILRPFNTFGPRQSERAVIPTVIRQMLDRACPVISIGNAATIRDFTFVEDTVAAFLAVGESSAIEFGRPYNAGSGNSISIANLVGLIAGIVPFRKSVIQEKSRMRPDASEVRALRADSRRLTQHTGWQPMTPFAAGLERTIAWWEDRLATGHVRPGAQYIT